MCDNNTGMACNQNTGMASWPANISGMAIEKDFVAGATLKATSQGGKAEIFTSTVNET
jgi:hypothetical protein